MTLQTFAIGYAAIALILLALVAFGVIPRTKWNQNASLNNLGRVHMRNATYYTATGQSMLGVLAQERTECLLKWIVFLSLIGVPVMKTQWFKRQMELIGHAAEIVVGGWRGAVYRETYLQAEAVRTFNNRVSYPWVTRYDAAGELADDFRSRFWIARALVAIQPGVRLP